MQKSTIQLILVGLILDPERRLKAIQFASREVYMLADSPVSADFWRERNVLVTGGAGFIGSHLVQSLAEMGAEVTVVDNLENASESNFPKSKVDFVRSDLLDQRACQTACKGVDIIYNAAAKVAGVGYNSAHPGEMFYRNSLINLNMLEAARKNDVDRYVVFSSACVYERDSPVPTTEDHGFIGDPEPSNLGYGWAKRLAEVQARVYASEYGMNISIIRPYNAYGPRDHFNESNGHVIPTLIQKIHGAPKELVVWGTGQQRRSFVYVSDVVQGLILSPERYARPDPINIGNNEEVSIAELVNMILAISHKRMLVKYDSSKPEGQLRRCPDLQKAKRLLGYSPLIKLQQGLAQTVEWYNQQMLGPNTFAPKAQLRR